MRTPHPAGVAVYRTMQLHTADLVVHFAAEYGLSPASEELLHGLVKDVRAIAYTAGVNATEAIAKANRQQGD